VNLIQRNLHHPPTKKTRPRGLPKKGKACWDLLSRKKGKWGRSYREKGGGKNDRKRCFLISGRKKDFDLESRQKEATIAVSRVCRERKVAPIIERRERKRVV